MSFEIRLYTFLLNVYVNSNILQCLFHISISIDDSSVIDIGDLLSFSGTVLSGYEIVPSEIENFLTKQHQTLQN